MSTPQLSVVMSVFNDAAFVGMAIDSILGQTFGDFEFLILDDHSTDGSGEVIRERALTDPRVRVLAPVEKGRVPALNRLFAEARGRWAAVMDSDDVCRPDRFARELDFLAAHPDHGVVSCNCAIVDERGAPLVRPVIDRPLTHEGILANLEDGPLLNHNAVMLERGLVERIGGYRALYRHAEDYDLWLRLSQVTRLANLPDNLVDYRVYSEQVSTRHVVEQTRNAAIAWLAHRERVAGRADPIAGLPALPKLDALDGHFGDGAAAYVRRRVVDRILYSTEALSGDGWDALLGHAAEGGANGRLWRAALRLLRGGKPLKAGKLAATMLRSAA